MKHMEFKYKDVYVKVHTSLVISRFNEGKKQSELVYTNIIDIDSRVQAVFAQFSSLRKKDDIFFVLKHAPKIGEKEYDRSTWYLRPEGRYLHQSQRENETLVTGIVVSERILSRGAAGLTIIAWDGNLEEKLFWAIEASYESPVIQEWIPYIISRLRADKLLVPLDIHDYNGNYPLLCAYDFLADEDTLDDYLSSGLKSGEIVLSESAEGGR